MRFAYLVMFHNNFEQVLKFLSVLDDENNDIYIYIWIKRQKIILRA